MSHPSWKKAERRAARMFGAERAPLSGSNGRQTGSDSLHPDLFIEAKQSKQAGKAAWNLYIATKELAKQEGKLPILALFRKRSPGFLVVVHSDDLQRLLGTTVTTTSKPARKKKKRSS